MRIWQRAANTPWAITEDHLRNILDIAARQNATPEAVAAKLGRDLENTYDVEYRDGVAILRVEGPLFRYANLFTRISGATSYERLAQDFQAAVDDDQVRAILLIIDSPGGEANGNAEFAEMIYSARGAKPVTAYVGGMGASAAYWIASSADEVIAHETAMLGSIGVRTALIDDSARMEQEGYREYVIVSSQSPDKDLDPASASDRSRVQTIVDDLAAVFVTKVARNRGVSEDTVLGNFGQGDVLVGERAVTAGLADRLGSYEDVLAELVERTGSINSPGFPGFSPAASGPTATEDAMTMWLTDKTPAAGEEQRHHEANAANLRQFCPEAVAEIEQAAKASAPPDDAQARAEAAEAERERVAAILNLEEAQGREATAQQLALTAGMTVEAAQRVLASTPKSIGSADFLAQMEDPAVAPDGPGAGEGSDPAALAAGIVQQVRDSGYIR